jgi:hypothetical protein
VEEGARGLMHKPCDCGQAACLRTSESIVG